MHLTSRRLLLLSMALTSGCLPHRTTETPWPESLPLPPPNNETAARVRPAWWTELNDPTLTALIEQALSSNHSLKARWGALEQAHALADQAASARYPTVSANASVQYGRSISAFATSDSVSVGAQLPISWELDLFARWRAQAEAADFDVLANRFDLEALHIATTAQVGEAWYNLIEVRKRRTVLGEQLSVSRTYLELVELRYREGLASAVDVNQQRQQVAAASQRTLLLDGEQRLLELQLALLVGNTPAQLDLPSGTTFPALPDITEAPTADLVWARPDVRAAQERVRAADVRVGGAIAARLPSIRLAITPGYSWQRNELSDSALARGPTTVHGMTFAAGATLNVPLFDGFSGRSAVRSQEAQLQIHVENLAQTILTALVEVETAVALSQQATANLASLEEQVNIAEATLESARDRFREGLSDFLPVLTALQAAHSLALNKVNAERLVVSRRIQLYRALGGNWTESLSPPKPTAMQNGSQPERASDDN